MNRKPLIILTGPTAVGKTAYSISLAKAVGGSIVSADSMQVYRGMDIGTAKISKKEMEGVPHELIDILSPEESFDVFQFQQQGKEAVDHICANGGVPLIVGGTGFYIQALLREIDFSETTGASRYREELELLAQEKGSGVLHDMLRSVDPASAGLIHPNNLKRVIRALEYFRETGEPISAHNERQRQNASPYRYAYFVLTDDRQRIYERIDRRVDQMIADGLEDEVRALIARGLTEQHTSMKGLGYREWFPYFNGTCSREEVIRKIKLNTRHFAKRQLTWFRREPDVIWVDLAAFSYDREAVLEFLLESCEARGVI